MTRRKHFKINLISLCIMIGGAVVTSCSGAKMSVADEQLARGEYFDAQKTYRKIYNKLNPRDQRQQRAEVAAKMAECYTRLGQDARAAAAYQNALRYGYPDSTLLLSLADAQHGQGNYTQAVNTYEEYLAKWPDDDHARRKLEGARKSAELKRNKTRHVVKNARLFNSRRSDFAPMFNGDVLYFTTTNEKVSGTKRSEITGMKRSDVWMVRKNERGEWQRPETVEGELNTEWDEGIVSFSPDGSTMYLTRSVRIPDRNTGVDIYTSTRSDAKWSAPVKFEITNDTISSYGHPAVSPSGNYLYFTSDMPGQGGKDIWRINLRERAGSLENLGEAINTPGDEVFPYMLTDSIMYFSSDGHPGLGGLDLFKATLTPSGGWLVENLGSPMNSEGDDFGITFATPGREAGYFSSNRGDGRGYDHLYSFELPDLKILISGWVLDKDEEPVPNAVIRIVGNDGSNQKAVARNDGSFSFPLQRGVSYVMLAGAKGYLNAKQEFTSDDAEEDAEYGIDFILASVTKPNIVDNIFYDFDKATLRPESREALDGVVQMLRDNPNITIEMASHTDRKGSDEYNIALSERRAKSVVDYLISAGIPAERLQYQGYGESRPMTITKRLAREFPQFEEGQTLDEAFIESLSPEEQEVADQINRRTEFQVLSVDYQMY
ncbi:OmpA family protein [Duncaniella sp.]|uniref:PorE family type IX secretion system protein n=1 Tax=Duncaniella sp. TaxID=2518496 RepID=UPI0026046A7B|nr:OmpA family protein [Duncaniella sp.]